MKYKLSDAQHMAKQYPDTFSAPSKDELNNLACGDYVKTCDGLERFWCKITSINGSSIDATVENDLLSRAFKFGDPIKFDKKNIYEIATPAITVAKRKTRKPSRVLKCKRN